MRTAQDWTVADLVALLPDKQRAWVPDIHPAPPSGLQPVAASFGRVQRDVLRVNGQDVQIGGAPGEPLFSIMYSIHGGTAIGWPQGTPAPGEPFVVRDFEGSTAANLYLDEVWALEDYEVMLTARTREVPQADLLHSIVVFPPEAYDLASNDGFWDVRMLARVQVALPAQVQRLTTIAEPVTLAKAIDGFCDLVRSSLPGLERATRRLLRNECRMQISREKQDNLACARVTLRGFDFCRAVLVVPKLEPTGSRDDKWERYFEDDEEITELWNGREDDGTPTLPNGWLIADAGFDAAGRKKTRLERNCGIIQIETHCDMDGKGANRITWTRVRDAQLLLPPSTASRAPALLG